LTKRVFLRALQIWNPVVAAGFVPGLCAQALSGVVMVIVMSSLAELASALPFSGGMYGYVRLTIGREVAIIAALVQTVG
jgi:amino acid transporter